MTRYVPALALPDKDSGFYAISGVLSHSGYEYYNKKAGLLMGDDIGSSMAVCFDFRSTNLVQLSNRHLYFYRFRCHHPLMTQLNNK